MSVQRGVIASHTKLLGRVGVFEAAYRGNVYVIDAITNNPGAGGDSNTTGSAASAACASCAASATARSIVPAITCGTRPSSSQAKPAAASPIR